MGEQVSGSLATLGWNFCFFLYVSGHGVVLDGFDLISNFIRCMSNSKIVLSFSSRPNPLINFFRHLRIFLGNLNFCIIFIKTYPDVSFCFDVSFGWDFRILAFLGRRPTIFNANCWTLAEGNDSTSHCLITIRSKGTLLNINTPPPTLNLGQIHLNDDSLLDLFS